MIKVKIKASGKHAQDIVGQLPGMGTVKPHVEIQQLPAKNKHKRGVPSKKGI